MDASPVELPPAVATEIGRVAAKLLPLGRERLRTYALVESPSGNAAALGAIGDEVAEGYAAAGGRPARVPGPAGDHLVTTWYATEDGPAGHVLLLGHLDTVWPVGQLAAMPYTDDGELIAGPGVYDMKGGLVVLEMAMRVLSGIGLRPARPVRAVVVADEEVGSPHGQELVERHLDGAAAVLGLEGPHMDGSLKTARRGSTRLRLTVQGREAHAAVDPGRGVSAIDELLDQLTAARRVIPDDGSTLFNIGRIGGGSRSNVIAGEAWAEIGLRFTTADVERSVLAALTEARPQRTGAHLAAEILSRRPTWTPRRDNPLLDTVVRVGEALGQRLAGRPAPGAGDTNLPGFRGLPTLDGFGPVGRGAHAADEAIVAGSLAERTALLAGVLAAL